MHLPTLFNQFNLTNVRLNVAGIQVEVEFNQDDRNAAWGSYVEMLTRIVTQPLPADVGDEQTALDSVYSLFATTREIVRRRDRGTIRFSKVAIPVQNQVVRPFTAEWHRKSLARTFDDPVQRQEFRESLTALQTDLRNYNRLLAEISGVEDLTDLETEGVVRDASN